VFNLLEGEHSNAKAEKTSGVDPNDHDAYLINYSSTL
jgi:hypothetical protein